MPEPAPPRQGTAPRSAPARRGLSCALPPPSASRRAVLTLNIIGCGRAGRTLARLFGATRVLALQDLLDRTPEGARECAEFAGAGRAAATLQEARPAELWLIATPDGAIAAAAEALAGSGLLRPGDAVFHLSGAHPATLLAPAAERGAAVASVHPVKSLADPAAAAASFAGTWCGMEGDAQALAVLKPAFAALGARLFDVDARHKTIYHAASVLVCNDLVALMEAGLRAYAKGGLPREQALKVMEPLVRETVDNVFRLGTEGALTGPVARGDLATVARQLDALAAWDGDVAAVYRALGRFALALARARGEAPAAALAAIGAVLASPEIDAGKGD